MGVALLAEEAVGERRRLSPLAQPVARARVSELVRLAVGVPLVEASDRPARQRVEVWFSDSDDGTERLAIPGLENVVIEGRRLAATLSGPIDPVVAALARHHLASLVVEEPNLEDAFLDLYGGQS